MWAIKRSIACNNIEHLTASDGGGATDDLHCL